MYLIPSRAFGKMGCSMLCVQIVIIIHLSSLTLGKVIRNATKVPKQRINSKISRGFESFKLSDDMEKLRKIQRLGKADEEKTMENDIPDDLHPKIVNGRDANEREFPWMVALHHNDRYLCSAFLISPTIVMTAAHCIQFEDRPEPPTAFYGIIGNLRRSGPDTRVDFSESAVHPDYGSGSEGDIAVFRTTEPVAFDNNTRPVCLPVPGRVSEFELAHAMGWGLTSNEATEPPEILQTAPLVIPPLPLCQFTYAFFITTVTDRHVCAGDVDKGICFGDSGGPLVLPTSGIPTAVGVASFVSFLGCARPFIPAVYTNIASYIDWLTETVGDTSDICFI